MRKCKRAVCDGKIKENLYDELVCTDCKRSYKKIGEQYFGYSATSPVIELEYASCDDCGGKIFVRLWMADGDLTAGCVNCDNIDYI